MQPNMSVRSILFFCITLFLNIDIAFGKDNKSSPASEDVSSSVNFTSSNLPIVVINTHGQEIPDDPKITADMGIIWNGEGVRNNVTDPFNNYSGRIGIELRGNSTQSFPKKPYAVETQDSTGANLDVSILGMPAENDWTFLASYIDRTFIRDPLAHFLSTLTGRWSSRCRFCELILNGEYEGVYIVLEKIKRTKNRLDLSKLTPADTLGDNLTGGYIYEVDGFGDDFGDHRVLEYPKIEDVVNAQLNYIRSYDDSFRNVMNLSTFKDTVKGYSAWIDVDAFIAELIVQETVRNSDAYGWSAYFHKDKDKKLAAGPVWDFDQSAGNSSYPDDGVVEGWMFANTKTNNTPFFWAKLFSDPNFKAKVQSRWKDLRESVFGTDKIMAFIDSCAGYLNEAQQRNFVQWPVLGVFIWRESKGYQDRNTYQKEIDYLKSFLTARLEWIDTQLLNTSNVASEPHALPVDFSLAQNYPNPFNPSTKITYTLKGSSIVRLSVYDLLGRETAVLVNNERKAAGKYEVTFNSTNVSSGIYFYRLQTENFVKTNKMVVIK
jgi:CotH kinase protein/Secretion system C-terminal sorting domain